MFRGRNGKSGEPSVGLPMMQLNDSVYQLHNPRGTASLQIVFFHGLQPGDYSNAHFSTWQNEDRSCVWPQTWLVQEFPTAQVLAVSYGGFVRKNSLVAGDIIGKDLACDLLGPKARIGQKACPVVLVGHSVGGLVIKELCCQAHERLQSSQESSENTKLENFLNNVKGVFFYATPHLGSRVANELASVVENSSLLKLFKALNTTAPSLNDRFNKVLTAHNSWSFAGLGESRPTKLGFFKKVRVVPEASARRGQNFDVVDGADHFSVCKPSSQACMSFQKLKDFLHRIDSETKESDRPESSASSTSGSSRTWDGAKSSSSGSFKTYYKAKSSSSLGSSGSSKSAGKEYYSARSDSVSSSVSKTTDVGDAADRMSEVRYCEIKVRRRHRVVFEYV